MKKGIAQVDAAASAGNPNDSGQAAVAYRDGVYRYSGRPDVESFHVEGSATVSLGKIVSVQWKILDPNGREFDATYENAYGQPLYKQQCRENWQSLQGFAPALLAAQSLKGVDAVSGATWAYNKFMEAAKALLDQAK